MSNSGGGAPRRIVVTGIGLVTPLAATAAGTFRGLVAGASGIVPLSRAPFFLPEYLSGDRKLSTSAKAEMLRDLVGAMPSQVAAAVIEDGEDAYYFDNASAESRARRERLRFAPTAHDTRAHRLCAAAVEEALRDALLLHPLDVQRSVDAKATSASRGGAGGPSTLVGVADPRRVGVNIGMGIPSLADVTDAAAHLTFERRGAAPGAPSGLQVRYARMHPFFVPKILGNMAAGATAIKYNCQGFVSSSVAACATGAHCIGESFRVLQRSSSPTRPADAHRAFRQFLQADRARDGAADQMAAGVSPADGPYAEAGGVDVMICGATEACVTPVALAGFARMRALSTKHNATREGDDDDSGPASASRPLDQTRDGFVMGEGAGILILEEYGHACRRIGRYLARLQGRGAIGSPPSVPDALRDAYAGKTVDDFIYGELRGFGVSCDAFHVAAPHPQGRGAEACMRNCLADAQVLQDPTRPHRFFMERAPLSPAAPFERLRIKYINAHATGTIGDDIELAAIQRVFAGSSDRAVRSGALSAAAELCVSSTKGSIGHLLGAAGSVEAAVALLALRQRVAPPTANLRHPCMSVEDQQRTGLLLVNEENKNAAAACMADCDAVLSTSFGFGGINTALLFTRAPPSERA